MKSAWKKIAKFPVIDIKKYGGKQVALVDGRIIASGPTLEKLLQSVRKRAPQKPLNEVKIFSVPKTLLVIYYAKR